MYHWANIDRSAFDSKQLAQVKNTCERRCFSTLNHNLGYCYNHVRIVKFVRKQAMNKFQGSARSFED